MNYKHVSDIEPVAAYLADVIGEHLDAGERVLWLVSGGSGVHVGLRAAELLIGRALNGLSVTLTDERYVPLGDSDENWQQLLDGGFTLPGTELYRPLTGADRAVATQAFGVWLDERLTVADYRIGLFGIGTDGHTAGIKPSSPAITATGVTTDFTGEDFERVTMTFPAIERLDEVVLQAFGDEKSRVLEQLLHEDLPLDEQPAQVLKRVPRCTLFTDVEDKQ